MALPPLGGGVKNQEMQIRGGLHDFTGAWQQDNPVPQQTQYTMATMITDRT